jgi:hypothetical protein
MKKDKHTSKHDGKKKTKKQKGGYLPSQQPKEKTPAHKGHNIITGILEITRNGMGYVVTGQPEGDVMVRPQYFGRA